MVLTGGLLVAYLAFTQICQRKYQLQSNEHWNHGRNSYLYFILKCWKDPCALAEHFEQQIKVNLSLDMDKDRLTITGSLTMARTPAGSHLLNLACGPLRVETNRLSFWSAAWGLDSWELSSRWNCRSAALFTKRRQGSETPEVNLLSVLSEGWNDIDGWKCPMSGVFWHQSGLKLRLSTSCSCQKQLCAHAAASTPLIPLLNSHLCPFDLWLCQMDFWDRCETVYLPYKLRPQGGRFMYLIALTESSNN